MSYAPYPAYKDSGVPWLGQVPEEWEVKRLSYATRFKGGSTPSKNEDQFWIDGTIPWVSPKDMKRKEIHDTEDHLTELGALQSASGLIYPGHVMMVVRSGILRHSIPAAINRVPVTVNQDMRVFLPFRELKSEFIYWVIEGLQKTLVDLWSKPGTTVESLETEYVNSSPFPVPSIGEQTAIADFLDKKTAEIDDLIAKKEELLRLLAEQRTALITHAVTKGLNPNAPIKPSGVVWFDQVPAHWQVRRLKDVGTLIGGAGFPHEFQNVQGEELYFYKVGDLAKSEDGIHLTSAPHTISRETAAKLRATVIPPDAILYAKIGAALLLNRRRISTANCCIDNNMTAWIVDPSKVLPLWGFYWMSTVDFGEHTNPGAVPSLSEGYQSILPITLPPLDEQQAIVDQLTNETQAIDQTAQKTREAIEHLLEYRTALITNAVTGKIKVA
ncbi:restriction endonuclease subunit S [Celeribacter sp.]|uniref:restriction endonuclease subunit S n=1 Tax=Celeribacter sp. TaxID=1890673 RepID=UPI003A928C1D